MATQVATSHTVHTRAPLKVPKRPQMNYVQLGIQKFIPYAVVFLLSLVIYSALRPSNTTEYPPYSPARLGEDIGPQQDIGNFAREIIAKRQEMFEDIMRRSREQDDAKAGEWKLWSERKAGELKQKLEQAKVYEEMMAPRAKEVVSEMLKKSAAKETVDTIKHVGEDIKVHAMDAAEWWMQYGEELAEGVSNFKDEKIASTQHYAYDAFYAWNDKKEALKGAAMEKLEVAKEKLEGAKELAKETLEDAKEVAKEKLEDAKVVAQDAKDVAAEKLEQVRDAAESVKEVVMEKFEELKDTAKDTIETVKEKLEDAKDAGAEMLNEAKDIAYDTAASTGQKVKEVVGDVVERMEGVKEGVSQAAIDFNNRVEGQVRLMPLNKLDDNTATNKIASMVRKVKAGMVQDADVRRAMSMKEEWADIELSRKVDDIVQQICILGDDVAEGVMHKLRQERGQGHC